MDTKELREGLLKSNYYFDVNSGDSYYNTYNTALHYATESGQLEIV